MAQTITDYGEFIEDAIGAVEELTALKRQEEQYQAQEIKLEKALDAERKTMADSIASTIRKRTDEINTSYDQEIGKGQERLKKIRAKREKARNQGVKDRIQEETRELYEHNRELKVRMKTLFQQKHVPAFCNSGFYYSLYMTRGMKEFFAFLMTVLICFLGIPFAVYTFFLKHNSLFLSGVYFAALLVFGGLYVIVGNRTKGQHLEALKEGRSIRNVMLSNKKKIRVIANSIRRDKNEEIYDLERFDDEIAQLEQDLAQTARKKKEALSTFENVTKTIISDEISDGHKARIEQMQADLGEVEQQVKYTQKLIKEKRIFITDNYEVYVGREFLQADKLAELKHIIGSGQAVNLSEAITVYRNTKK